MVYENFSDLSGPSLAPYPAREVWKTLKKLPRRIDESRNVCCAIQRTAPHSWHQRICVVLLVPTHIRTRERAL